MKCMKAAYLGGACTLFCFTLCLFIVFLGKKTTIQTNAVHSHWKHDPKKMTKTTPVIITRRPVSISGSEAHPWVRARSLENAEAPGAYFSWNKSGESCYLGRRESEGRVDPRGPPGDAMESRNMQLGRQTERRLGLPGFLRSITFRAWREWLKLCCDTEFVVSFFPSLPPSLSLWRELSHPHG